MEKIEAFGLRARLANQLRPLSLLIWFLISVGFPAVFYILEVTALKRTATIYAQDFSEKVKDVVLKAPDLWKYQNHEYNEILFNNALYHDAVVAVRILDETGRLTAKHEHQIASEAWWCSCKSIGSASIIFNNHKIGTVQVELSQSELLEVTLTFLILSTTVGTSLAVLLYFFPVKIVGGMEGQIQKLIQTIQCSKVESDRLQVEAQASEQRFRDLVQGLDAIVWEADAATGQFSFVSQRAEELLGYPIKQWTTNTDFQAKYIHSDEREQVIDRYRLAISEGKEQVIEYRAIAADDRVLWLRDLIQVVKDKSGQVQLLRGVIVDITEFKRAEHQLLYDAFHDVLTGLPNRSMFMHRLEQAVEQAKRYEDYLFAVLFLDLDRFKVVNDSLGHKFGDQLLIEISRRLEMCIRSSDIVARLGGDEFAILLEDIKDINKAISVAERVHKELALPFNLSGHEVFAATSIGIALSTIGYDRPETLLRDADTAMYHAKSLGKSCHQVFNTTMHARAVALLQLETDLRRAIERQEFRVYYQPIVLLTTGRITGFEALVRWQHPDRGFVPLTEFIPLAEETGLIIPIGEWVLCQACHQMRVWQEQFPTIVPLTISVNFSGKQFTQPDLAEQIAKVLERTGLNACSLKLEITESVIMENTKTVTAILLQLKALGVHLCMDDFGTGYSSLSYLHSFPINTLKIDRSFVSNISLGNEESSEIQIIQTIIMLAHSLGLDVIAEGVETAEQLLQLKQLKCKHGQGYFFSKPMDSKAAEALIAAHLLSGLS